MLNWWWLPTDHFFIWWIDDFFAQWCLESVASATWMASSYYSVQFNSWATLYLETWWSTTRFFSSCQRHCYDYYQGYSYFAMTFKLPFCDFLDMLVVLHPLLIICIDHVLSNLKPTPSQVLDLHWHMHQYSYSLSINFILCHINVTYSRQAFNCFTSTRTSHYTDITIIFSTQRYSSTGSFHACNHSPHWSAHFPNVDLLISLHMVTPKLTVLHGKNGIPTKTLVPLAFVMQSALLMGNNASAQMLHSALHPAIPIQPNFTPPVTNWDQYAGSCDTFCILFHHIRVYYNHVPKIITQTCTILVPIGLISFLICMTHTPLSTHALIWFHHGMQIVLIMMSNFYIFLLLFQMPMLIMICFWCLSIILGTPRIRQISWNTVHLYPQRLQQVIYFCFTTK